MLRLGVSGCWCDSVRKPLLHRSGQDEFIMIKLAKDTLMCDMAGSGDSSTLSSFYQPGGSQPCEPS